MHGLLKKIGITQALFIVDHSFSLIFPNPITLGNEVCVSLAGTATGRDP